MQIAMKDKESIAASERVFLLHGGDRLSIKTITKFRGLVGNE